jgi:Ca2+-binding EF-hand superfamily protein
MKQVALMAIAVQSDPADIEELKMIFEELDVNGDGNINFDELTKGLHGRENAENLLAVLKGADVDGSGTINYTGK